MAKQQNIKKSVPEIAFSRLEKSLCLGSCNAAKALSEMIGTDVRVSSNALKTTAIKDVPEILDICGKDTLFLPTKIVGSETGIVVLSASAANLIKLSGLLLHKEFSYFSTINSENSPSIRELSEILAGYFISELNGLLKSSYTSSSPPLLIDPYRAFEKDTYKTIETLGLSDNTGSIMLFETEYKIQKFEISLRNALLLKGDDLKKTLQRLNR